MLCFLGLREGQGKVLGRGWSRAGVCIRDVFGRGWSGGSLPLLCTLLGVHIYIIE